MSISANTLWIRLVTKQGGIHHGYFRPSEGPRRPRMSVSSRVRPLQAPTLPG